MDTFSTRTLSLQKYFGFVCGLVLILITGCGILIPDREPTYSPIHTNTAAPTFTTTPSPTITPAVTPSPSPSLTPTLTPTPTAQLLVKAGTALPDVFELIIPTNAYLVSGIAEWSQPVVTDLSWLPGGYSLAVSGDSEITLYDVQTLQILRKLFSKLPGIVDIEFSPDGRWLVSGNRAGDEQSSYHSSLELWYGPDWKPLGLLYASDGGLSKIKFSPVGETFLAAYASPVEQSNFIDFWNTIVWNKTGKEETGTVLEIGVSSDGVLLATTPDRYAINIIDLVQDIPLYTLYTSFTGAVNTIAFSPTLPYLASGHYDGRIFLWDMTTGAVIFEFDSGGVVQSLAFSPDGQVLASGNSFENGQIRLWDVQTGVLLRELDGHENGVTHLEFSPGGELLASASYDGKVRLWGIRP